MDIDIKSAETHFNNNFPRGDINSGVIREIKEELAKIEKIVDAQEKLSIVNSSLIKHRDNLNTLTDYLKFLHSEGVGIDKASTIDEYSKQVDELKKVWEETWDKVNRAKGQQTQKDYQLKSSHCSHCKSKPPTNHYIYSQTSKELKQRKRNADPDKKEYLFCSEAHFEKWQQKNYFTCAECLAENYTGQYKKNKKDGQKFCSDNCYYTHYAEKCDNCLEKCISSYQGKATGHAQTYYSDRINKTGTLCSKCHQEKLKEEKETKKKDQEWEESCKRLDKNMDDLVEGMTESVKGKDEEENLDNEKEDNNNPVSNPNLQREKESNNLLHYFTTNNIQSITLTNNKLLIKYNHKEEEEEEEPNTKQLQEIKDYLQKQATKTLTRKDLEQKTKENSSHAKPDKNNKAPLIIGGGVIGTVSIGLVFILVRKKTKKH